MSTSPVASASSSPPTQLPQPSTPYRQIRAHCDDQVITVYQAYSAEIAKAAVAQQKLSASPAFSYGRMTWIKPSWAWMMYRSGYSYKDARQSHILAITMKHEHFLELLAHAFTGHGPSPQSNGDRDSEVVRVQWDPERTPSLHKLPHRSIQIGIPRGISQKWVEEWIVSISDVTEKARELKRVLDGEPGVGAEELVERGLVPVERVYEVPEDIARILKMDGRGGGGGGGECETE